jgi:hypothetical protein
MWGWSGINAFEWSTLQEIVARLLNIAVGTLTFNIGSLHLYEQHWKKASRIEHEDISYPIHPFNLGQTVKSIRDLNNLIEKWFDWEELCRKGEATLDGLEKFDEPLFKSWAAAIAYYWQREQRWLLLLEGTALGVAIARTPASVLSEAPTASSSSAVAPTHNLAAHERTRAFYTFVKDLHAAKHASYGDSWKKRGEKMSILANMARKVDRLGVGDEYDSSADTLIDLLVYTIKYGCWLSGKDDGPVNVNFILSFFLAETEECVDQATLTAVANIADDFNTYCDNIDDFTVQQRIDFTTELARRVAPIARDVWYEEQQISGSDEYKGADVD